MEYSATRGSSRHAQQRRSATWVMAELYTASACFCRLKMPAEHILANQQVPISKVHQGKSPETKPSQYNVSFREYLAKSQVMSPLTISFYILLGLSCFVLGLVGLIRYRRRLQRAREAIIDEEQTKSVPRTNVSEQECPPEPRLADLMEFMGRPRTCEAAAQGSPARPGKCYIP